MSKEYGVFKISFKIPKDKGEIETTYKILDKVGKATQKKLFLDPRGAIDALVYMKGRGTALAEFKQAKPHKQALTIRIHDTEIAMCRLMDVPIIIHVPGFPKNKEWLLVHPMGIERKISTEKLLSSNRQPRINILSNRISSDAVTAKTEQEIIDFLIQEVQDLA